MTTTRIPLPTLFDEDWDSVVICTYGADLSFYETGLWRQIHNARHRLVFADQREVRRHLLSATGLERPRQLNRSYVLAEVSSAHAAHGKLILLLRPDGGRLAVGSGNLNMGGYASQGECFSTYSWSEDDDTHLGEFLAARRFLDGLVSLETVDPLVGPLLQNVWKAAPWIYRLEPAGQACVRDNLSRSHMEQFVEAVGGRKVKELVLHAPFYDHKCIAVAELMKQLEPGKVTVLLQEQRTSVDPSQLDKVLQASQATVNIRSVSAEETGAALHAKFLIARCGDTDICQQGSPNLSRPALLLAHPAGNIEVTNLFTGPAGSFDHLVSALNVSKKPVRIDSLGLKLVQSSPRQTAPATEVRQLAWNSPMLTGCFAAIVTEPPVLLVGDEQASVVTWTLTPPNAGETLFQARIEDGWLSRIEQVEALTFLFGESPPSPPCFPYHVKHLNSLAAGDGRAQLISRAGDFDLEDEELEELLLQLDEILVVDGHSLWRMVDRKAPPPDPDDDTQISMKYGDLHWETIQAHPKLAQYRNWTTPAASADASGLGVLLASITDAFERELERRRSGNSSEQGAESGGEELTDGDPEDPDEADAQADAKERRSISARSRARRQFQFFLRRFVRGISNDEFVQLVGPSVVLPTYIVFNSICRKLFQLDLADRGVLIESQLAMWHFFWGTGQKPGYLQKLSPPEQTAAHELFASHHATTVFLCSLLEARWACEWDESLRELFETRDVLRTVLDNSFWSPTSEAVIEACTMLDSRKLTAEEFVEWLEDFAYLVTSKELRQVVADTAGMPASQITERVESVYREGLGMDTVPQWVLEADEPLMDSNTAAALMSALKSILPDDQANYLRFVQPSADLVAFADYEIGTYLFTDRKADTVEYLEEPLPIAPSWQAGLDRLYELAEG